MNKTIKDSCEKLQEAKKGRTEIRPTVSFVSDSTYHDSVKVKAKFIKVIHRYNTTNKDIKTNNYQVHEKKFAHGNHEDILIWDNQVGEVIKLSSW